MTIDRYHPRRKVVAWFRSGPDAAARATLEERGFRVEEWQEADLASDASLSGACAIVFTQQRQRPTDIASDLGRHGRRLLDFDCNIVVRHLHGNVRPIANVANAERLPIARLPVGEVPEVAAEIRRWQRVSGDLPRPHLRLYHETFPWKEIAHYEMEHPAGPAPATDADLLILSARGATLDEGVRRLTKRAFYDCREVHLTPIPGGRSGAQVFLAFAEVRGRWSLPYFVKTGERGKILDEYKRYEEHVDAYVPFHLGPSLDHARCCLGAHEGVLVGDFVEESESLLDCAREGRAGPAIACLFDRTLRGWHRDGKQRSARPGKVMQQFPPRVAPSRWLRAHELGARTPPYQLQRALRGCGTSLFLWGQTHGDLHASNVRVRGAEAILIDFLQCCDGPLLRDAAALEASLLVGSLKPVADRDPDAARAEQAARFAAWRESIDPLYSEAAIDVLPQHVRPKDEWAWFHTCVRQIRLHAFHMERARGQYALALGAALVFKASKDQRADEPERSTRALAYAYGERLLLATVPRFPRAAPPAPQVA